MNISFSQRDLGSFFAFDQCILYSNRFFFCFKRTDVCRILSLVILTTFKSFDSVNVFLSMLAKPEFRLEMLVGSCTAWSMEFNLMARCPATRLSAEETIPSTHFSARLERENTFLAPCSLTWNQQLSVSERASELNIIRQKKNRKTLIRRLEWRTETFALNWYNDCT